METALRLSANFYLINGRFHKHRLLALGACPNYVDPEKGNSPLHIAAKEGQELQVELLWLYGADVGRRNGSGQKAMELAKAAGHVGLNLKLTRSIILYCHVLPHF